MDSVTALAIEKPVSLLNTEVSLSFKEFFANLGKAAVAGSFGDYKGALEYGIDSLAEIGLLESPEGAAWALVSSSLKKALAALMEDSHDLFAMPLSEKELDDLAERVDYTLSSVTVKLDKSFLIRPQDLPLLEDFKSALLFWFNGLGLDKYQADALHGRLKGAFVLALHEEWSVNAKSYTAVHELLETPFADQSLNENAWQRYSLMIQNKANQRVLNEAFSLRHIYIPLRGYFEEESTAKSVEESEKIKRYVCDLHDDTHYWITHFDKNCSLRVVSGGPGSGKSTFATLLAADLAGQKTLPVIYIPLHHFNLRGNLVDALGSFVREDQLKNPLVDEFKKERLLLIFDGLDELSMQGQASNEIAAQFIDELRRMLDRHNDRGMRWQALVTGRDLSVQASESNLRGQKQVLHILPYHITNKKSSNYIDDHKLLAVDQRDLWWEKYGEVKGVAYSGMPTELTTEHLQPITREPLLNYLLSLSYERSAINFDDHTSLNNIYFDLLNAVHERQYAGYQHEANKHLSFAEFLEVLEEIALAIWHGNGRTASERYLYERCVDNGMKKHLEKFAEGAKKGVVRLLTAFYFRQFGTENSGDKTFEFTHKSFGEYLTARRLVNAIEIMVGELRRHEKSPKVGWTPQHALEVWIKTTGPTRMDKYLYAFVNREISSRDKSELAEWQKAIALLLGIVVRDGSPMENIGLSNFSAMLLHSIHAEEALLVMHSCCALKTGVISETDWGLKDGFGTWFRKIQGQRLANQTYIAGTALHHMNFKSQLLDSFDFFGVTFSGANLSKADLRVADLREADLSYADLSCADLSRTDLSLTDLSCADLTEAYLSRADLGRANLKEAILREAFLREADLSGADLSGAILRGADLRGADLRGADLSGADLREADLRGADLRGVDLSRAVQDEWKKDTGV